MAEKIDLLITKFLSGNTTEQEDRELKKWREISSENETYFLSFEAAWNRSNVEATRKDVDVEWAWQDLQQRLTVKEEKGLLFMPFLSAKKTNGFKIAAGFLLLVFLSVVLALIFTDGSEKPAMVAMQKIPTTIDTDVKKLSIPDTFVVNEVSEPVRSKARVKSKKKRNLDEGVEMFTLVTTDSAKAFLLPDQTIVYLNQHSKLNYAKDFNVSSRKVLLEGEAYFEISRDTVPFEVACGNTVTRVRDASFNLRGKNKTEQVELIVVSGNAEFTGVGKKEFKKLVITKGESGMSEKGGVVTKSKVQRKDYKWWQKKNLRAQFKRLIAKIKVIFE